MLYLRWFQDSSAHQAHPVHRPEGRRRGLYWSVGGGSHDPWAWEGRENTGSRHTGAAALGGQHRRSIPTESRGQVSWEEGCGLGRQVSEQVGAGREQRSWWVAPEIAPSVPEGDKGICAYVPTPRPA